MRIHHKRLVVPAIAAGITALALPLSAGSPALAADDDPDAGATFGYSALTVAAPVYVEIYEPTIPIPATPQAELQFGYTKVLADSSSSRGRASFLWPGDAVGEGLKTIVENLGLPPEIAGPIADQGYPVQVNSGFPSGPEGEANEPIPGSVMRTGATEKATYAQTGFSSTCDTTGGDEGGDGGGGGGTPTIPGLPELPIPGLPTLLDGLLGSTGLAGTSDRSATTSRSSLRTAAADEPADCQVPAQLSALASFGGFEAYSYTERTADEIVSTSRSAVGDISIAGGLVKLSGVNARVTSSSDGTTPKGKGKASYGTITIAGQTFGIGPDGIEAAGSTTAIPGLPDAPAAALKQLGITITQPKPSFVRDGKEVKSVVEALVVEIDTKTLFDAVRTLPLQDLLNQLPAELKDLTKLLGAAVNLSPRMVLHLGRVTSKVETVDPIDIPTVDPTEEPSESPSADGGGTGGGTGGGGGTGSAALPPADPAPATGGDAPVADLPDTVLASSKLPPLFSIPGFLMVAGIGGAVVAGSYARRLGLAALGGSGACSHGLDSGLPDLRKANS